MQTFLTPIEIQELTGRIHRASQTKVLNAMGIEHRSRPDGSVAILRAHINKVFDGNEKSQTSGIKKQSPNWAAI